MHPRVNLEWRITMEKKESLLQEPPNYLPTYRLLTGPDDASFCRKVSEAIKLGFKLYGSPSLTYNGENVIAAQAVIWPSIEGSVLEN
jgi:hypothetical protein